MWGFDRHLVDWESDSEDEQPPNTARARANARAVEEEEPVEEQPLPEPVLPGEPYFFRKSGLPQRQPPAGSSAPEDEWSADPKDLARACVAFWRFCEGRNYPCMFFGRFELSVLGNDRGCQDIDVMVANTIRMTDIVIALNGHPDFVCNFYEDRTDAFQATWDKKINLNIFLCGPDRMPRRSVKLYVSPSTITPLNTSRSQSNIALAAAAAASQTQLGQQQQQQRSKIRFAIPFMKTKYLLAERIRGCAARKVEDDIDDVYWMIDNLRKGKRKKRGVIDLKKVKKLVMPVELEQASRIWEEEFADVYKELTSA